MDLPCVEWQKHVEQKWSRLTLDEKKCFSSLLDIDEVFDFGLSQIIQEDVDFLSGISKDYPVQKDLERAARCRKEGNSSFTSRDYTAAVLHYSQGVCHASLSSEQLSMCYANRSAALFHLQRYRECLEDIDRALNHGYPSHLRHKLQDRHAQCLNHLPNGVEGPNTAEQGAGNQAEGVCSRTNSTKPNPKSPNSQQQQQNGSAPVSRLSPGVSVCFSPGKGRHLLATEGIAAGEVIVEDRAYSCVLIPGMGGGKGRERRGETEKAGGVFGTEERHCHLCLAETVSPVPCEGCSYARYCSEGCRRGAWEWHHRWECPIGAELRAAGVMSQLALRVALKAGVKEVLKAREPIRDADNDSKPIREKISSENTSSKPVTEKISPKKKNSGSSDATSTEPEVNDPSVYYHGDSYRSIYHLLPHLNGHAPSLRYLCSVTIATLYLRLHQAGPPPVSWEREGACESRKCSNQSQAPEEEEGDRWAPELSLLGSVALRHMLQLRCNAQAVSLLRDTGDLTAVQSTQEVRIATAIFPTLSVLNHSCCPNTSLNFRTSHTHTSHLVSPELGSPQPDLGSTDELVSTGPGARSAPVSVCIRASRDISPGQEILHCYGPHSSRMVLCERRRRLKEQYHFLCICQACSLEQAEGPGGGAGPDTHLQCGKCKGPLKCSVDGAGWCVCLRSSCGHRVSRSELDLRLQEVRVQLEQAVDLLETDRPDQSVRLLQRAVSQADVFLRETHSLQGQLADAMARAYCTMGEWRGAASQLERSVVAISSQYGEDSIELGRQLFKLAQLHFNGGFPGPALSVMSRARRLLSLHCGPHCPEVQELQAMEDCLQGAM
ncbi:SET and MYND domain-containing protein 4 isoform X2 [Coregonus clupeaformis]|uniref:SET and MYND domain-containing protein 4 isoform X2 n=1 Tax=Coregonus clupeaformis TaxID=59861 RepID=UPI001BDF761F|nr:SET and MYND domain-containing protein 4 isoform X2 [Coregonus clupeaformis]